MRRLSILAGMVALSFISFAHAQDPAPVRIYVTVPADAFVWIDGARVQQTGPERRLVTPPIAFGKKGRYVLRASFARDGVLVVNEHIVTIEGGKEARVDLSVPPGVAVPRVEPKKTEVAKVEPKKTEPPKVDPKKTEPKKTEVAKVEPKKTEPPKVDRPVALPETEPKLNVPFAETPAKVVAEMLKVAGVKEGDVVFDLGCGDGRIVIAAVKDFKAKRGLGLDLSPARVRQSKSNAEKAGVADKVEIREGDVLKLKDVSEASVITLYLLPDINEKLKPMLRKTLKPGSRIVSHEFDLGLDWKPDKEVMVKDEAGNDHMVYLWTIPQPKRPDPPAKKVEPAPAKKVEAKKDDESITVPYVPTPQSVVEEMLKFAGVKEGEIVYDLGCGDGRIVVTAVKDFKAKKGVGVDIDPVRIKESIQTAKNAGVSDKVTFTEGDVLKIKEVSEANVVCLYLFPEVNERLKPMLQKSLKPGSRVVSHDFLMGDDWKPDKQITVKDAGGEAHNIFLWTIKENKK